MKEQRVSSLDIHEFPHHYPEEKFIREVSASDPVKQFLAWYSNAEKENVPEVNAMSLATASKEGHPSCRTVLLKHIDKEGLVFYTNYESRKSKELMENPYAMVTLFWPELLQQIHVEGRVEKTSLEESETYFATRPRGSQIGAWASRQGEIIPNREFLEKRFAEFEEKYRNREIPLPPYWGGFRLIPTRFEFWQGKENRLHDRLQYVKEDNKWRIDRLSP